MASNNSGAVGADAILRQLDADADSTSVEVTLYLPWGMATGITVPDTYFGHYVAHFFTKHDAGDIAGRLAALEAEQDRVFIHFRKARCYVAGQVVTHDSLRVRLSDVSAWTVAGVEQPQPANHLFGVVAPLQAGEAQQANKPPQTSLVTARSSMSVTKVRYAFLRAAGAGPAPNGALVSSPSASGEAAEVFLESRVDFGVVSFLRWRPPSAVEVVALWVAGRRSVAACFAPGLLAVAPAAVLRVGWWVACLPAPVWASDSVALAVAVSGAVVGAGLGSRWAVAAGFSAVMPVVSSLGVVVAPRVSAGGVTDVDLAARCRHVGHCRRFCCRRRGARGRAG